MTTASQRAQLISSGEHIYAIRQLGNSYSPEEYLRAVQDGRDLRAGERYADSVLGVDVDALLGAKTEHGGDVIRAVEASLRRRGIAPESATYSEYAAAVREVGS